MAKANIVIFVFFALAWATALSAPRRHFPHARGELVISDGSYSQKTTIIVSDKSNKAEIRAAEIIAENIGRILSQRAYPKVFTDEKYLKGEEIAISIGKNAKAPPPSPLLEDPSDAKTFIFDIGAGGVKILYPQHGDELRAACIFLEDFLGFAFLTPHEAAELPQGRRVSLKYGHFEVKPSFAAAVLDFPKSRREKIFAALVGNNNEATAYVHSPQIFLTKDVFKFSPELFASRNSRRISPEARPQVQPDFMNWDLPWFYARKADEFFLDKPSKRAFSVVPSDSDIYDDSSRTSDRVFGFYESERNYSNIVFEFTNSVADIMAKKHPDRYVFALAYGTHKEVPNFKLRENVILYVTADRYADFDAGAKSAADDLLRRWADSGVGALGIYDYNYGYAYPVPRYAPTLMADWLKRAHSAGARFYIGEFSPFYVYDAPKMWILRSLLKDVSLDARELEDKFFRLYYAESSEGAKEFFAEAERAWTQRRDIPRWLGYYKRESVCELFPPERVRKMDSAIRKAVSQAKTPSTKRRVKALKDAFDLSKLCIKTYLVKREISKNPLRTKEDALKFLSDAETLAYLNSAKKAASNGRSFSADGFSFGRAFMGKNSDPLPSKALELMKSGACSKEMLERLEKILGKKEFDKLLILRGKAPDFFDRDFSAPQDSAEGKLPKGWSRYSCSSQNATARIVEGSPVGEMEFSNIINGGVQKSIPCLPGRLYEFSAKLRGSFTGGAMCYFRMVFADNRGRHILSKTLEVQKLGSEAFPASLSEISPKDATTVSVGIFFVNLLHSDSARIESPKLRMFEAPPLDNVDKK